VRTPGLRAEIGGIEFVGRLRMVCARPLVRDCRRGAMDAPAVVPSDGALCDGAGDVFVVQQRAALGLRGATPLREALRHGELGRVTRRVCRFAS